MKRIIISLFVITSCVLANAQNIGIGTSTPNSSAQLDVSSTTKGMLIPRMTGAQRAAIPSPATGLLVIQTNTETAPPSSTGLYIFEGSGVSGTWRRIARADEITGGTSSWTVSGSNQYSNLTGNVGIGTVTPTSKFHLVGDYFQEGSVLNINDASAKIQLLNGGVNKASMYLWSDNLRIGTNAGNTVGDVHIQTVGSIRLSVLAVNGNVGIGTLSPTERLHVSGNILSSNRIDANGVIEGAGISSLGSLYVNGTSLLQGSVTGNAAATFNSTITSNTSMVVNDPAAIFQLQNAGVNKGFTQLSGDNLRFGTNSGNANGNVILRMDGTDMVSFQKTASAGTFMQMNLNGLSTGVLQTTSTGNVSLTAVNANAQVQLGGELFINNTANKTGIGTSSPTERLHVNGNIVVNGSAVIDAGRITATTTGSAYNLLPLAYGRVTYTGNKAGGTPNFTSATRTGPGAYDVYVTGLTSSSVIMVTPGSISSIEMNYDSPGKFRVRVWSSIYDEFNDCDFHFVVYNP